MPIRSYQAAEMPLLSPETHVTVAASTRACATHCPYCSLQCGMHLESDENAVWKVTERNFPTNRGGLCQKGWSSAELLSNPDRLLTPLVRDSRTEPFRPATWDEAIERVARAIEDTQSKYGRDGVGVFGGGGLTNEKAYLLGKFARVALRTSQIDYNGRFCMASAAAASIRAFGIDRGLPFPLADLARAEAILLVGSNLAETMPPVMQYFQAQKNNGGSLIVVDPRSTPTTAAAALHLQITPGTDAALANGLLHLAIREGMVDEKFIAERTNDFDLVKRAVSSYWPDRVERITGIPEHQLRRAAGMLGRAKTAMILTARGPEQQSRGVNNVLAFINLALALGKVGKPHCGYGCLTGQGNGQGGREHGQKADQLPGYRKLDNPAHRAYIAEVWGVPESDLPLPGRSAYEMFDAMGTADGIRALLVFGSNIAVSAPRARHIMERLDALDFLVVSDFFLSETAARADVVLPAAQWAEEAGTMTNLEGRVILRQRAMLPPASVRTDLEIISGLAARLGHEDKFPAQPEDVFEELRRATCGGPADYAGITWDRIRRSDGIFWPCPNESHPGTPRLFLDRFATEDGRARFHAIAFQPAAEQPDDEYPLYLTTGRVMAQYQSGTQTRRVAGLKASAPEAFVQIHPSMAQTYGITGGDDVTLTTRRGSAVVKAQLTPSIRLDTVFVPFHYAGQGSANLLTNPALDPVSR
ncbi:MAG TPA: molybdopterin oxidoreductase family protein, partial [Bryobacteraceae bacterium]|nr:molybdopterin oxidoreductase family protein [Bryobacteraceae bacterium]